MSESKGGGGFGFAPRGDPARKPADRLVAPPADRQPPEPPRSPRAPIAPADQRAASPRMPWAWLLIGLLLGTGGTLLTSTLWLPERQSDDWNDTSLDDPDLSADGEAVAAVGDPAAADPEERGRSPGSGQPEIEVKVEDITPEIVAAAPEIEDTTPEIETIVPEVETIVPEVETVAPELVAAADDQLENQLSAYDESGIVPDQAELAERSELLPRGDAPSTIRDDAIIDGNEKPVATATATATAVADPASSSAEREEPLEALTSDRTRSRSGDGAEDPAVDAAGGIERRRFSPLRRTERAAIGEAPSAEEASQEAALDEVSDGAGPASLPLRIRQALQRASAERETRSRTNGSSRDRLYRVQLAAVNDEASAREYWLEVNARLPGVFSGIEPVFDQRVIGERQYLRIWVGAFDSRNDAIGYCDWLKAQGQDCFVTRAS